MRALFDHQVFSLQNSGGISRYYFELTRALAAMDSCACDVFLGLHRNIYPFEASPATRVWQFQGRLGGQPGAVRYALNHAASNCLVPFQGAYDIYHPTLYRWLGFAR